MTNEMQELIIDFINNNFKDGEIKNQIINFKSLLRFLKDNDIVDIELNDAESLVLNSDKLAKMLSSIYVYDNKRLYENDILFTLMTSYCNLNKLTFVPYEEEKSDTKVNKQRETDPLMRRSNDLDLIRIYINELEDARILSMDDQVKLFKRIEKGDESAKEEVLYNNLRLVMSIARRYDKGDLPLGDLIQEGNIGLLRAIEKYDYRKGYMFSTYATWWIRQAITRAIYETSKTIRIPVHSATLQAKIRKVMYEYEVNNGTSATPKELSEILDIPEEKVNELLLVDTVSLNSTVNTDDGKDASELGDFIEAVDYSNGIFEEKVIRDEFRNLIFNSDILTQREKEVLALRNGFVNGRIYRLEEIGKMYGITRERIRQIENKAIRKLRKNRSLDDFDPKNDEITVCKKMIKGIRR